MAETLLVGRIPYAFYGSLRELLLYEPRMDDSAPQEALKELGLSKYAAETLVGLQQLGVATASDIAEVTDVPRSQVYGAIDELEEVGVVDVQETSPKRFTAAAPETVGDILQARLARQTNTAVTRLQEIDTVGDASAESEESIWRAEGVAAVAERVRQLVDTAADELQYYCAQSTALSTELREQLEERADAGLDVTLYTTPSTTTGLADDASAVSVRSVELPAALRDHCTRLLVVDQDAVLVGVPPTTPSAAETCFWSSNTQISIILVAVFDSLLTDAAGAAAEAGNS